MGAPSSEITFYHWVGEGGGHLQKEFGTGTKYFYSDARTEIEYFIFASDLQQ
jgi:hypothetical protein